MSLNMPTKRKVSNGIKKQVAGRQRYTCAGNVKDYACPLNGLPFDEAGYEIDHAVPLSEGGSNDAGNLQALCLMCHRVKSNRAAVAPKVSTGPKKTVKKKWDIRNTEIGYLYTSDSDD